MHYQSKIALLVFFICCHHYLHAQYKNDSLYAPALAVYNKTIGINKHLYIGTKYIDYDHRISGNPFFSDTYFATGNIVYNDVAYNNATFFYDILHDNVVLKNYNDTALVLVREKVSAFDMLGHYFINLQLDNSASVVKDSGFYDVLYNGNVKLLAKRKKIIAEKMTTTYSESAFIEKDTRYVLLKNTLYAVNDKKSLFNVLKDKKSVLSKYIHQSKIKFRKDPEAAMIKITAYYDSLNNTK